MECKIFPSTDKVQFPIQVTEDFEITKKKMLTTNVKKSSQGSDKFNAGYKKKSHTLMTSNASL